MTLEEKLKIIVERLDDLESKYFELSDELQHVVESFCEIYQKMDRYLKEKENDA